jgi:hypothetical protein
MPTLCRFCTAFDKYFSQQNKNFVGYSQSSQWLVAVSLRSSALAGEVLL